MFLRMTLFCLDEFEFGLDAFRSWFSVDRHPATAYSVDTGMSFSFSSFTFSDDELLEIYEALLIRATVEDELRIEEGLEPVHKRPLLEKIEEIAVAKGMKPDQTEAKVEDELWRQAWYAVTDEFAWRRAREETIAELGERAQGMREDRIEHLSRLRYDRRFNDYVAEIERLYGINAKTKKKP
jgi:hypothetical protein